MTLTDVVLIVAAYCWGGIPTAYLASRLISGTDIRDYGSGNVGASNALVHLGARAGVAIGLFDLLGKGILPILVVRSLDAGLAIQAAAGLAAISGHNWSPFIRFTGGRGVGTTGGVVLAFALWYEALIAAVLIAGLGLFLLKDTGLLTLVTMIVLPISALTIGALGLAERPVEIVVMCAAIAMLLAAKRLTANWESPVRSQPVTRTLICRILWDRDVPRQEEWKNRAPAADIPEARDQ